MCLAKVPPGLPRSRIRVRGDAGVFGKRVVELLDGERVGYTLLAKEYRPIKALARGCRFRKLHRGREVGEFRYQPGRWQSPHRFVAVRRPIPTEPVEAKQLTLFKDTKYAYHVPATNLRTHRWRVWRCLPPAYRTTTLKTVGRELPVIPGRLVKIGNRYRLRLPKEYHFKRILQSALTKLQGLHPVQIP